VTRGSSTGRHAHVFLCSSPLQLVHAHLVRRYCLEADASDCFLFCEPPLDVRLVEPQMWHAVVPLPSSKRVDGNAVGAIREALQRITEMVNVTSYTAVHLVVSDLFWLLNNVAVAKFGADLPRRGIEFDISILDEGAILYTTRNLGWQRRVRALGRSAYLAVHGLPSVIVRQGNADYRHPLCRTLYCLHPELVTAPPGVRKIALEPHRIDAVYGDRLGEVQLPERSCLYLSQPLYHYIGIARQRALVNASREMLKRRGMQNFFFKPHHFDTTEWQQSLETDCGFRMVAGHSLPVEVWAKRCNAEIVFGHFSSALINLPVYGYGGRVIACGLAALRDVFSDSRSYAEYRSTLERLNTVEIVDCLDADAPPNRAASPAHAPAGGQ
jgi:hypothetical protein